MAPDAGRFHRFAPGPPLSAFVDFLWISEGYAPPHARERLLPTGTMELVFTMDGEGRVAAGVAGARSEPLLLDTSCPRSIIAAHFRPGGGHPFFGVPSGELHNRTVALDVLWGRDAASVRDRLWDAETPARRFEVLGEALVSRARGRLDGHPAVRYALRAFEGSTSASPVADVLQGIGMSPRRFVEVFRAEVGLGPKVFCRVRRFHEALRRTERLTDVDWADVAQWCGYYDQAHFNHDFRAFSGLTPSSYLRRRTARTHVAIVD